MSLLFPRNNAIFEEKGSFPRRAVHDRFDDLIFHEYVVVPIYVAIASLCCETLPSR
jgi:hypothetical protein